MTYALSRLMSTATASYAGYCFYAPEHLGKALGASKNEQPGYDLLANVFGVRDLAISSFGVLGRSDRTVRTAMWIRIACDVGDGIVLASRLDDDETKAKALAATLTWGALNFLALHSDKKRTRRAADKAAAAAHRAGSVVDKVTDKLR